MTCPSPAAPSYDICPTQEQIVPQLLALLPRGRAWGTHDGGPFPGSTLYGFYEAVADVWAWINGRICDLAQEFFCATQSETNDLWMEEYGLPDGCDPFPDLCGKVAATGGTRCTYYVAQALRLGWSITCWDVNDACGFKADQGQADCIITGDGLKAGQLYIEVNLAQSEAFTGRATTPALADLMVADGYLTCPPDLTSLECLLTRLVGAHIELIFGFADIEDATPIVAPGVLDFSIPGNPFATLA